jgi:dihydroorotate dehydrogenase (fumarate)
MRADLTTRYLGLTLRNPIMASAGPMTGDLDSLCRLEEAGIAAAVLPSLFEEQINHDQQQIRAVYDFQSYSFAESLSYFPELKDYNVGPRDYLRLVESAKRMVSVPIIASLNGSSPGGWVRFAKLMEEAGADAIELNIYFVPTDPDLTAHDVESRYAEMVATVRQAVSVPLAVKIGAQFSCLPNFVTRLAEAGANGVVLFNRYLEPDIDLHSLQVTPQLVLSNRHEVRLPMRWIAILRDYVNISLAASSGIHYAEDVVKLLLAGADVCMLTSALLKHGCDYVAVMLPELQNWLDVNNYDSVEQMKGSMSYGNSPDSGQWERANYMKAIVSYTAVH